MRGQGEPRKAGDILRGFLRKNPALRGPVHRKVAQAFLEALGEILPEKEGKHCFLLSFGKGVVTVGVDSAVLRHELQCFHADPFLEAMKKRVPEANLRKVRFVIAPKEEGMED